MSNGPLAAALVIALVVGAVAPATTAAVVADDATAARQTTGTPVNVSVGQQLSTVVVEADSEVRSEVEESAFELRFEADDDARRAGALADRAEELAERARAIGEDYRAATRAFERGELTRSEYAQRIATLNARAEDLAESARRLRERARRVPTLELRAEGFNRTALRAVDEQLDPVTGVGAAALLRRFTGRSTGQVEIEFRDGLAIEVEGEDGELSREIERPRDDSTNITVSQADALGTANGELGAPANGTWSLVRASVHEDDGYYKFEFALTGAAATGEAEVRVDGSSGQVFRLETEIEAPDDGEAGDDDRDEDDLAVVVAEGTPRPNATVTLLALAGGEPVPGAAVTMNGERVGTTDANGTVALTLPRGEAEIRVETDEADGELEFDFGDDDADEEAIRRHLAARGTVENGTVTIRLTYDGDAVSGADVSVDDRTVGTTDANGVVTFEAGAGDDGAEDLEVDVHKGAFAAELEFEGRDGELTLVETSIEDVGEDREEETDRESETDDGEEHEAGTGTETESERDDEADDRELAIRVAAGDPGPGATITIAVTLGGEPTADAPVWLDDERVGTTDDRGRLTLTLPDDDEAEIEAEHGDFDARLRFEFDE